MLVTPCSAMALVLRFFAAAVCHQLELIWFLKISLKNLSLLRFRWLRMLILNGSFHV